MSKSVIFWIIILLLWLALGSWLFCTYICGTGAVAAAAPAAAAAAAVKDGCAKTWTVRDGKFRANSKDHFQFVRSSYANLPASASVNSVIDKTATYLKNNKDRSVTITGYYDRDEKNNSLVSNIGEARANTITNILRGKGVPANQLNTTSKLMEDPCWRRDASKDKMGIGKDTLRRGASFAFGELTSNADRLAAIKSRLLGKPVTLYFQTNSDNINLNASQRTDLSDLIYYLDNVAGAKLNISGHTDNIGNVQQNVVLSEERADFAMNYLMKRGGIQSNRMAVQGFGPNRPVADNNTEDGRAKNRRVEVTLN